MACCGGWQDSEAQTTVCIEVRGARGSTSDLGLVILGFTTIGSMLRFSNHTSVPMEGMKCQPVAI